MPLRPASELHTAIDLMRDEMDRLYSILEKIPMTEWTDEQYETSLLASNILIAHEVLRWVSGVRALSLDEGHAWLAAFLLPDPDKIGPDPSTN